MKWILPLLIFLFTSSLLSWNQYGSIRTTDGFYYEGIIDSRTGQISWRQDIYEVADEKGEIETFILEPTTKGTLTFDKIKEIIRLSPNTGPARYIILTNGYKAKLLLKYMIITRDDKKLYISDFITLNDFMLELPDSKSKKQVYITKIEQLRFFNPNQKPIKNIVQKSPTPIPTQITKIEKNDSKVSFRTQVILQEKKSAKDFTFIFLSILFFIFFVILLVIIIYMLKKEGANLI